MAKPIAQTAPPRNIEPVSPIKTFAGCRFQTRKPRQAPARAMANMEYSHSPIAAQSITKESPAITVTEPQSPSTPSVRFTALVRKIRYSTITG